MGYSINFKSYRDDKLNKEVIKALNKNQLVAIDNFEKAIKLLNKENLEILDIDTEIRIMDKKNKSEDADFVEDHCLYMGYDMDSYNN